MKRYGALGKNPVDLDIVHTFPPFFAVISAPLNDTCELVLPFVSVSCFVVN